MSDITSDDWDEWLAPDETPVEPPSSAPTPAQLVAAAEPVFPPFPETNYQFDASDIPDADSGMQSKREDGTYDFVKSIDILEMYRKYCGKMEPKVGSKRESVMISCPVPGHVDNDPSAWLNLDKGLWNCGTCGIGGDGLDIYLMNRAGLMPGDRSGPAFRQAIEQIGEDNGFSRLAAMSGAVAPPVLPAPVQQAEPVTIAEPAPKAQAPVLEPGPAPATSSDTSTSSPPASTESASPLPSGHDSSEKGTTTSSPLSLTTEKVKIVPKAPNPDADLEYAPTDPFDWRSIYHPDGFRHSYMEETAIGRLLPHEFHACMADLLVGLSTRHQIVKQESNPVYGNAYACMLGPTGVGKSRAMHPAFELLNELSPYNEITGEGTKILKKPGSGEQLIMNMVRTGVTPNGTEGPVPVVAFLYADELSDIVARSARKGSTLQPALIEMYSAVEGQVTTASLSGGEHVAFHPYLCMVTGTQPDVLPKLLNDDDLASGFLNRFMFYVATRPDMPANYSVADGDPPYQLVNCRNKFEDMRSWAATPLEVRFDTGVASLYEQALASEDLMGYAWRGVPILARLELLFKKLILLNCADVQASYITEDNIVRAVEQIKYFISSYGFTRKSMEATDNEKILDKILQYCSVPGGITEGRLRNKFRRAKYLEIFDKVLKHAISTGAIHIELKNPTKVGGRPASVILPGPSVD